MPKKQVPASTQKASPTLQEDGPLEEAMAPHQSQQQLVDGTQDLPRVPRRQSSSHR